MKLENAELKDKLKKTRIEKENFKNGKNKYYEINTQLLKEKKRFENLLNEKDELLEKQRKIMIETTAAMQRKDDQIQDLTQQLTQRPSTAPQILLDSSSNSENDFELKYNELLMEHNEIKNEMNKWKKKYNECEDKMKNKYLQRINDTENEISNLRIKNRNLSAVKYILYTDFLFVFYIIIMKLDLRITTPRRGAEIQYILLFNIQLFFYFK